MASERDSSSKSQLGEKLREGDSQAASKLGQMGGQQNRKSTSSDKR